MKTNRLTQLFILVTVILLLPAMASQAQVTIGDVTGAKAFSVLEIISNGTTGLRMPHLTTTERNSMTATVEFDNLKTTLAKGLTIYNSTTDCLEFWNGTEWIARCQDQNQQYPEDANATINGICIPYMFTYQTMNMSALYNGTATSGIWVVDGEIASTGASFGYTPAADIALETDELGNRKKTVSIFCQIEVNGSMVQSRTYEILVVEATKGTLSPIYVWAWENDVRNAEKVKMAFAHANLGAENTTDPCDCLGDLYQWGRKKDGHQVRTSQTWPLSAAGNSTTIAQYNADDALSDLDEYGQVKSGNNRYGRFIKNTDALPYDWRSTEDDDLWGNDEYVYSHPKSTPGDPCPEGWKVPTIKQWSSVWFGSNFGANPANAATVNEWTWLEVTYTQRGTLLNGALMLPVGGYRNNNAAITDNNTLACYWATSTNTNNNNSREGWAQQFQFDETYATPQQWAYRSTGRSVRCIPE